MSLAVQSASGSGIVITPSVKLRLSCENRTAKGIFCRTAKRLTVLFRRLGFRASSAGMRSVQKVRRHPAVCLEVGRSCLKLRRETLRQRIAVQCSPHGSSLGRLTLQRVRRNSGCRAQKAGVKKAHLVSVEIAVSRKRKCGLSGTVNPCDEPGFFKPKDSRPVLAGAGIGAHL